MSIPRLLLSTLAAVCWLGASAVSALAQGFTTQTNAGQIERARLPNPTLPLAPSTLSLGEPAEAGNLSSPGVPSTSGDSDLGVQSLLRAPERPQPWSLFANGGFVYTSNVALTNRVQQNDVFYVGEGGVGYDFKLTPELSFSAAVRQQYFAYNKFDQLDFGSLNVGAGLSYTAHQLGDAVISAQLGFTRLTQRGVWDNEFYRAGSLSLGVQKLVSFGRAQLLSVGGDVVLNISLPHVAQREEFGFSVGYIVQFTRNFSLQTGGRLAYFLYPSGDRHDFNASGSTGVAYTITPWCSVGASISGTLDRSSRPVFNYEVFNTGASVFLRLRF